MVTTTNFTVAQGKALMRSSKMREHWNSVKRVYESWSGWCCAFTYWFTGAAHSYPTAYDAYLAAGTIVSKNAGRAPAGAIHYFRSHGSNPRPGHVAPSLGNGVAAMATSRGVTTAWGDHTGTVNINAYIAEVKGSFDYLGWSYSFGTFRMRGVQTLEAIKAVTKATPSTYKVVSGDTLGAIGTRFKVSVPKLQALNKGKYPTLARNPDSISVGWVLKLK